MTADTDTDSTDSDEPRTAEAVDHADVGETITVSEPVRDRTIFDQAANKNLWDRDRDFKNLRVRNARVVQTDDGHELRYDLVGDVTKQFVPPDDYHWKDLREEQENAPTLSPSREKWMQRGIITVVTGVVLGIVVSITSRISGEMTINGEPVVFDPVTILFPILAPVLLVAFIAWALPKLPGKVMSA